MGDCCRRWAEGKPVAACRSEDSLTARGLQEPRFTSLGSAALREALSEAPSLTPPTHPYFLQTEES